MSQKNKELSYSDLTGDQKIIYYQGIKTGLDLIAVYLENNKMDFNNEKTDPLYPHIWNLVIEKLTAKVKLLAESAFQANIQLNELEEKGTNQ